MAPEVRRPRTFTTSSDSSTSAEALLESLYMDSSEDTNVTQDVPLAQATDVPEVGDTLAHSSSLSDSDFIEDDHQGPSASGAGSSSCDTAGPTPPTGNRKRLAQKRKQVDIDELMVTALTENRHRLNELKSTIPDPDEIFLLSMKPLLSRLDDRKKEITKLRIHKLLVVAAFPACEQGSDNESA